MGWILTNFLGGKSILGDLARMTQELIMYFVGITPNHVNNFLGNNFTQRTVYIFIGIGLGTLTIQVVGFFVKYNGQMLGGQVQESPWSVIVRAIKTAFLAIFYPFVIVYAMEIFVQFAITSLGNNMTFSTNSFAIGSNITSGLAVVGGALLVSAISAVMSIPVITVGILAVGLVIFVVLFIDLFMDLIKFIILTVISPLLISLEFSGLGYFQNLLMKQMSIALAQILRIWLFSISMQVAMTASFGLFKMLALLTLAININKLIDLGGGGSTSSFGSIASMATQGAMAVGTGGTSAIASAGASAMGKIASFAK